MSKSCFVLDTAGVGELLKSKEAMDVCMEYANAISARYDGDCKISGVVQNTRVDVYVYTDRLDNDLLKVMQ